jgi:hypothetical protein
VTNRRQARSAAVRGRFGTNEPLLPAHAIAEVLRDSLLFEEVGCLLSRADLGPEEGLH